MRVVKAQRHIGASRDKVWAVLADFPNIAEWNRGVNRSYGEGAVVQCQGQQLGYG